ncbi:MAG TPA: hypothetical protein VI895_03290 [Bdellovibrionota bacterium]|nr:hypothetical protein [Bdellovibrionota bacterium]
MSLAIPAISDSAWATCGLNGCPIDGHEASRNEEVHGLLDASTVYGSVAEDRDKIDYWSSHVRGEAVLTPWFRSSLVIPFGMVTENNESTFGLSDIAMETTFLPFRWNQNQSKILVGSQIEFPTGDEDAHLGAGHYEWLPYAAVHVMTGQTMHYVQSGWRISFSGDDGSRSAGPTAPESSHLLHGSVLDPHSGNEFVYRAGTVVPFFDRLSAAFALQGQTVLEAEERGTTYLSVLPELYLGITRQLWLQLRGEMPVTSDKRFDWRMGFGLNYVL